ncbi:MAG: HEAT repeat domain-containing protein [Planctomycetota bacterium]
MHLLNRPILAVVCPLFVLLVAGPAMGQRFVANDIVEADAITPEMYEQILIVVDPLMFDLIQDGAEPEEVDTEEVAEARKGLLEQFRPQSTDAYLEALSKAITESRMSDAVKHKSPLVRYNAMLVLRRMVDEGSDKMVLDGLKDENDAVKRGAAAALGERMLWWKKKGANNKIGNGIKAVVDLVDQAQPPHPAVVGAALEALLKVNTSASREALIELLNKRVAVHAADPDLSYSAEQPIIENFSATLRIETPRDMASIRGLSRAMFRYSALIVDQLQKNQILQEAQPGAGAMMYQCMLGKYGFCLALQVQAPADHAQAPGWIKNGRWAQLAELINGWRTVLKDDKFGLTDADLEVLPDADE